MKCRRRIYSGISSSSRFPFEFANVPSLICLLTRGPSSWSAICISPVLSFAVSNKKTPICSFEQENLKSKKIQKKCCLTPKHCAAFNTGHAKRADDRKNLHWEIGRIDMGGKIKKVPFRYSDTLFFLYFLILRQVCFLPLFDLRPPSFANFAFYKRSFSYSCFHSNLSPICNILVCFVHK